MKLFEDDFGVDESPEDKTQITTTLLYFSEEELKQFKRMAKQAMRILYGAQATEKGNLSDTLLAVLNKFIEDENNNTQETFK